MDVVRKVENALPKSAVEANKALEEFGENHRDKELIEVIDRLSGLDLTRLAREHDNSVLNYLVGPKHIVKVLQNEPAFWERSEKTKEIQSECIDLVLRLLVNKSESEIEEVFDLVSRDEKALASLQFCFAGKTREEIEEEKLFELIRTISPTLSSQVIGFVNHDLEFSEAKRWTRIDASLRTELMENVLESAKEGSETEEGINISRAADDMFTPLD